MLCALGPWNTGPNGHLLAPPIFTSANTSRIRIGVVQRISVNTPLVCPDKRLASAPRSQTLRYRHLLADLVTGTAETEWAKLHSDFFVSGSKSVQEWMESIAELNPSTVIYPADRMDGNTFTIGQSSLGLHADHYVGTSGTETFRTSDDRFLFFRRELRAGQRRRNSIKKSCHCSTLEIPTRAE